MGLYDRDYARADAGQTMGGAGGRISAPLVIWIFVLANLAVFFSQSVFRGEDVPGGESWGFSYPPYLEFADPIPEPVDATPERRAEIARENALLRETHLERQIPTPEDANESEKVLLKRQNAEIQARNAMKIAERARYIQRTGGVSIEQLKDGKYWTLVSHQFVNATVFSAIFCCAGIFFLGSFVVRRAGSVAFVLIYLVGGVVGSLPVLGIQLIPREAGELPWLDHLGATASVSALFGFLAVSLPAQNLTARVFMFLQLQAGIRKLANLWIVINVGIFLLGMLFPTIGVSWLANAAGTLCGFGLGRVLAPASRQARSRPTSTSAKTSASSERPYKTREGDEKVIETQFTDAPPDYNEILDKINREGIGALTEEERKALERASEELRGKS